MIVALGIFVGAAVIVFRELPDIERIRWVPLLLGALGGVPASMLLNSAEYRLTGRAAEQEIPFADALRVTVLSSAANVLPLPGSVIVRVQMLAERGLAYGRALAAAGAIGAIWVSMTLALAGSGQLAVRQVGAGAAVGAAGALGLILGMLWLRRQVGREAFPALARRVALVEVGFVAAAAVRMYLVLIGLDADVGVSDALALTIAGAVANAMGFFPGGLGLRELLAAGIAPLVGLPAVTGLSATVIQQLAAFVLLGVAAAYFTIRTCPEASSGGGTMAGGPSDAESVGEVR